MGDAKDDAAQRAQDEDLSLRPLTRAIKNFPHPEPVEGRTLELQRL
jgi:hypothetical protein